MIAPIKAIDSPCITSCHRPFGWSFAAQVSKVSNCNANLHSDNTQSNLKFWCVINVFKATHTHTPLIAIFGIRGKSFVSNFLPEKLCASQYIQNIWCRQSAYKGIDSIGGPNISILISMKPNAFHFSFFLLFVHRHRQLYVCLLCAVCGAVCFGQYPRSQSILRYFIACSLLAFRHIPTYTANFRLEWHEIDLCKYHSYPCPMPMHTQTDTVRHEHTHSIWWVGDIRGQERTSSEKKKQCSDYNKFRAISYAEPVCLSNPMTFVNAKATFCFCWAGPRHTCTRPSKKMDIAAGGEGKEIIIRKKRKSLRLLRR